MTTPARETNAPSGAPDRDWLLELARALQTTLEARTLVELFATHLRRLVLVDALEFVSADERLRICTADPGEHRCSYQVVLQGRRLGDLVFSRAQPFEADELAVLEVALANLAHPLRNALLYREALDAAARDPLTGLNNRSSLDAALEREVELSRRHGTAFSMAMLDIDRFKQINDQHGHLAGDRAIVAIAQNILAHVRDSDMVFRYGGEEFCVLLSNTAICGAAVLGERIRIGVEQALVEAGGTRIGMSMSVGVAELQAGMSAIDLIARADGALYRAKQAGRNQVVAA